MLGCVVWFGMDFSGVWEVYVDIVYVVSGECGNWEWELLYYLFLVYNMMKWRNWKKENLKIIIYMFILFLKIFYKLRVS